MIPHRMIFKRPDLVSERPDFRPGRPEVHALGSERPQLILKCLNWVFKACIRVWETCFGVLEA